MASEVAAMEAAAAPVAGGDEIDKVRAELAAERAKNERLTKKTEIVANQQREAIGAVREDVVAFVKELGDENANFRHEIAPIMNWTQTCHEAADPELQLPLARVLACASAKVKRTLDQASQKSADSETLGKTLQENEQLKEQIGKLQKRETDLEAHVREMDARNGELDRVLKQHNLTTAKFDFSKISSREAGAAAPADGASAMEVDAAARSNPVAAAAAENPSLLSFLMAGGGGGNRFTPTNSSGHHLSALSGSGSSSAALA
jgi:hypothetical protein